MFELLLLVTLGLNATSDIIDRKVSRSSDFNVLSLWTSIVQLLLICPFVGLVNVPTVSQLGVLFVVGWFSSFARSRWYLALSSPKENLSRFSPLLRMSSVIVLIFAVTLLGEHMSMPMAAGGALMILAGFLVSFERAHPKLEEFLHANRALGLVLVFALANAMVTVAYKYLLEQQLSIVTIYFFLKFFQCLPLVVNASAKGSLTTSYEQIANIRLFVGSRSLQTIAALIFLVALSRLNLTRVEPIVALSPLIFLVWEWIERRRHAAAPVKQSAGPGPDTGHTHWLRYVALLFTAAGFLLMQHK